MQIATIKTLFEVPTADLKKFIVSNGGSAAHLTREQLETRFRLMVRARGLTSVSWKMNVYTRVELSNI